MRYLVFDIETSGQDTYGKFQNPFDLNNEITMAAFKRWDSEPTYIYQHNGINRQDVFESHNLCDIDVIIAQNASFDLSYIWSNYDFQDWLKAGGVVYDTKLAEYLLTAQIPHIKKDLDTMAKKYGGTVKDDRVKELYKQGVLSKDIDKDLLIPYCIDDVLNTEVVYLGQQSRIAKHGMENIIREYMSHLLATVEMSYNGLYVSPTVAQAETARLTQEVEDMRKAVKPSPDWPEQVEFQPTNNGHISAVLFGGSLKYETVEVVLDPDTGKPVTFKGGKRAGQEKTRKATRVVDIIGYKVPVPSDARKPSGVHTCDKDVLLRIVETAADAKVKEFCENLMSFKAVFKLLSTYYSSHQTLSTGKIKTVGMLTCVNPATNCVHTEFKTTDTRTGRLSSGTPNIQNAPVSVRKMFTSRYEGGSILSIDFSQLEVRTQAYLTGSKKFAEDIDAGVDFHIKRMCYAEGIEYEQGVRLCSESAEWKEKRKRAKGISFAKSYGAAPQTIAKNTGIPIEVINKVFAAEDEDYPEINQYITATKESAESNLVTLSIPCKFLDKRTGQQVELPGEKVRYGLFQSRTGKRYAFEEKTIITKNKGTPFRFLNIPDVANYENQGMAADIVSAVVGKLFRKLLKHRDKCLLVAEVHDEIVIDCRPEYVDFIYKHVVEFMNTSTQIFEASYNIKCDVNFKAEGSKGVSWYECKS